MVGIATWLPPCRRAVRRSRRSAPSSSACARSALRGSSAHRGSEIVRGSKRYVHRLTQTPSRKEDLDALVASLITEDAREADEGSLRASAGGDSLRTSTGSDALHESTDEKEKRESAPGARGGTKDAASSPAGSTAAGTAAGTARSTTDDAVARAPAPPTPAPIPQKILYSKEVQTESPPSPELVPTPEPLEEAPATPPRPPTPPPEELGSEFADFVHAKSAVIERVLDEDYDVLTDYTHVPTDAHDPNANALRHVHTFFDAAVLDTRSVTDMDWSSKHPELLAAGYNRQRTPTHDADGLVAVWNMHLRERPEFTFEAPTDVTSVLASPFHPTLYVGGTYSGQILLWDARQRGLPVQRTPLSFSAGAESGHCAPVYSLRMVGTAQAHHLVSASTDGLVCTWTMDMLAKPQESIMLTNPLHPRSADVGIASLDVPADDATRFLLGTEEGNVYGAARYNRAGAAAGLDTEYVYVGHAAPVTRLECHPTPRGRSAPADFSDLFLTSSMDWTSALWRSADRTRSAPQSASGYHYAHANPRIATSTRTNPLAFRGGAANAAPWTVIKPLCRFENQLDYVMDVRWHPHHPALFAQVDVAGRLEMYNLNYSCEVRRTTHAAPAPEHRDARRPRPEPRRVGAPHRHQRPARSRRHGRTRAPLRAPRVGRHAPGGCRVDRDAAGPCIGVAGGDGDALNGAERGGTAAGRAQRSSGPVGRGAGRACGSVGRGAGRACGPLRCVVNGALA